MTQQFYLWDGDLSAGFGYLDLWLHEEYGNSDAFGEVAFQIAVVNVTDVLATLETRISALQAVRREVVVPLDVLQQIRNAQVSEPVGFIDVLRLSSTHLVVDPLLLSDRLTVYVEQRRAFLDSLLVPDQAGRERTSIAVDVLLPADSEGKRRQSVLADTLLPLETVVKQLTAVRLETVDLADRAAVFLERRRELADSLALLDRIVQGIERFVYATDTIGLMDTDRKAHERRLLDALPPPVLLRLTSEHGLSDVAGLVDSRVPQTLRFQAVTDALALLDSVRVDFARKFDRLLTDAVSLLDTLQQQRQHKALTMK